MLINSLYSTEYATFTETLSQNGVNSNLQIDYTLSAAVIPQNAWIVFQAPRRNVDYTSYGATAPYDSLFPLSGTPQATLTHTVTATGVANSYTLTSVTISRDQPVVHVLHSAYSSGATTGTYDTLAM